MSFDLGVWFPQKRISNREASELYARLCDGDLTGVTPHPAVDAFYAELTERHPEIDTIPEERFGDHDHCPWSCSLDHSPGYVIMSCVWSRAKYVEELVENLARKHGLAVFDPQSDEVIYSDGSSGESTKRGISRTVGCILGFFALLFAGLFMYLEKMAPSRSPLVIYLLAGLCVLMAMACFRQAFRSR